MQSSVSLQSKSDYVTLDVDDVTLDVDDVILDIDDVIEEQDTMTGKGEDRGELFSLQRKNIK